MKCIPEPRFSETQRNETRECISESPVVKNKHHVRNLQHARSLTEGDAPLPPTRHGWIGESAWAIPANPPGIS